MTQQSQFPEHIDLAPVAHAEGVVRLPGSKSISNRILLLAALAEGDTRIGGLLASDDTHVMLNALRSLGVNWSEQPTMDGYPMHTVQGAGSAAGVTLAPSADLFMGNAGTAIRPLTAALAVIGGDYTLHGVPRMHERPIGDLVDALNASGAQIAYT
eukprot:gene4138-4895_t